MSAAFADRTQTQGRPKLGIQSWKTTKGSLKVFHGESRLQEPTVGIAFAGSVAASAVGLAVCAAACDAKNFFPHRRRAPE